MPRLRLLLSVQAALLLHRPTPAEAAVLVPSAPCKLCIDSDLGGKAERRPRVLVLLHHVELLPRLPRKDFFSVGRGRGKAQVATVKAGTSQAMSELGAQVATSEGDPDGVLTTSETVASALDSCSPTFEVRSSKG